MDFHRPRRANTTEGWALSDKLVKNPYVSRWTSPETASLLCAEFKRMVFEDGVPVRPSRAHYPDYIALTEAELQDTSSNSRATIHGVRGSLREAALEKFAAATAPETEEAAVPTHPEVGTGPVLVYSGQPPVVASVLPDNHELQMKG